MEQRSRINAQSERRGERERREKKEKDRAWSLQGPLSNIMKMGISVYVPSYTYSHISTHVLEEQSHICIAMCHKITYK